MLSHCYLLCVFCSLLCSDYSFYALLSVLCVFVRYVLLLFCVYMFLCTVSPHVCSCFFSICAQFYGLLPPDGNPIEVNKYVISHHVMFVPLAACIARELVDIIIEEQFRALCDANLISTEFFILIALVVHVLYYYWWLRWCRVRAISEP